MVRTPRSVDSNLGTRVNSLNHLGRGEPAPLCLDFIERLRTPVLEWFAINGRSFPWRETQDTFCVFVAEVLLRQTQAGRVVRAYQELVGRYPDARSLAEADADELRRWFEPLGLVRRADLLIEAAKTIVNKHDGRVPSNIEALLALPGMGIYSARAVLSLSFDVPVPMIDEGSGRVLRRILGMAADGPAYSDPGLLKVAQVIIPKTSGRAFNLGLVDLAAAYCRPLHPKCPPCPLTDLCQWAMALRNCG